MKKYTVRLASLTLFFATGAAIGMEPVPGEIMYSSKVYVKNNLSAGKTGQYELAAQVNGQREFKVQSGQVEKVGNLSGIKKLEFRRTGLGSGQTYSKGQLRTTEDQTQKFMQAKNDILKSDFEYDLLITVEWANPGSWTDYDWKYTYEKVPPLSLENVDIVIAEMPAILKKYIKEFDTESKSKLIQLWKQDTTPNKVYRNDIVSVAEKLSKNENMSNSKRTEALEEYIVGLYDEVKGDLQ